MSCWLLVSTAVNKSDMLMAFWSILCALANKIWPVLTDFAVHQVAGERYVYKFVCDPDALFSMAFPDNQRPFLKAEQDCHVNEDDTLPLTHFEDNSAYLLDLDHCSNLPYAEGFAY
ncbi:hypothetical protein lerEdw1_008014 [Lerista edwardsae]|nr:hypothetical protein lerEdw1_008014 [Lerista edwardsae]